jgi:hypothetical protein
LIRISEGSNGITSTSARVALVFEASIRSRTTGRNETALVTGEVTLSNLAEIAGIESRANVESVVAARVGLDGVIWYQRYVVTNEFLAINRGGTDCSARTVTTARTASTAVIGSAQVRNFSLKAIVQVAGGWVRPNSVDNGIKLRLEAENVQLSSRGQRYVSGII